MYPLLASKTPTSVSAAEVYIAHSQLRDLVVCPRERGLLNYVHRYSIIEHDCTINRPPRALAELSFEPGSLAALPLDSHGTLFAAGGLGAEVHLSYHVTDPSKGRRSRLMWQYEQRLPGSYNNSVILTSLNLTQSNQSSVEPILGISNNDCSVRLYQVPVRTLGPRRALKTIGYFRLDIPINYSSISPDGQTLLSVGDSSKVYLHHIRGGDRLLFERIHDLAFPSTESLSSQSEQRGTACFSAAFSSDGTKFAVVSEEGVVAIWDMRSTKPLKVIRTRGRMNSRPTALISAGSEGWSGWHGHNSGVRVVKFGGVGEKEVLAFTEHTSLMHIVDARTFEFEEVMKVPTMQTSNHQGEVDGMMVDTTDVCPGQQQTSLESDVNDSIDIDLAGVCFDPSGKYLYAASRESVAEWSL